MSNPNPPLKGRIKPGETRNPGGMTKEQREARDLLNADLRSPEMRDAWRASYLAALQDGNALILKDYADRVGGKPKESLELSEDPDAPVNPLRSLSVEDLQAIARAQREKESAK